MKKTIIKQNIRSSSYKVARTLAACIKCAKPTKVFAIVLPKGHESFRDDEWCKESQEVVYYRIRSVEQSVLKELAAASHGKYRMALRLKSGHYELTNHCEICGEAQNEYWLHNSRDSGASEHYAFNLYDYGAQISPIKKQIVKKPFSAFGTNWIVYSGCIMSGRLDWVDEDNALFEI